MRPVWSQWAWTESQREDGSMGVRSTSCPDEISRWMCWHDAARVVVGGLIFALLGRHRSDWRGS